MSLVSPPLFQLVKEPGGKIRAVAGIDKLVQVDVEHQHLPTWLEPFEEVLPVHRRVARSNQVQNVGAVKALAVRYVGFDPDHLLDWRDPYRLTEDRRWQTSGVPLLINRRPPATEPKDKVNIILTTSSGRQPMGSADPNPITICREHGQRVGNVARHQKKIEILGVSPNSGIVADGCRTGYDVVNVVLIEKSKRLAMYFL